MSKINPSEIPNSCDGCGRSILCDLIIPCEQWRVISPTGDLGGMLCPTCIIERLHISGLRCQGAFMGGPVASVSMAEMEALRRVENIELALEGFRNRWGAALDDRIREGGADPSPFPDEPGLWEQPAAPFKSPNLSPSEEEKP